MQIFLIYKHVSLAALKHRKYRKHRIYGPCSQKNGIIRKIRDFFADKLPYFFSFFFSFNVLISFNFLTYLKQFLFFLTTCFEPQDSYPLSPPPSILHCFEACGRQGQEPGTGQTPLPPPSSSPSPSPHPTLNPCSRENHKHD